MTYCGYVEILIVIISVRFLFLFIMLFFFLLIGIFNEGIWVVREKIFLNNFFGDLELIFSVWSLLFLCIVIFIRSRVIIFSFAYIRRLIVRNFILLYVRFVLRMLWLIISGNFYWLILGWDGLGVVSFLLILFYMNHERINNGLFTLFQNRIGDLFFVFFIIGSVNLGVGGNLILKFGLFFLILGACVKRAQFPFNAWLLAAIRAPTPISSLVHSSTLVVAGVFILLQFHYCLVENLFVLKYIAVVTLCIRRFGLINETDIKKLIAYSTIRHVGLIMYFISIELFKIVYFHLNIHAMFKSLIFICFGFVILVSYHGQDRRLISLRFLNPIIKIVYYFSCFCLGGLPFLRGFFSKDFIIEKIINSVVELSWILLLLLFLSIRVYYSLKLINLYFKQFSYEIVEKNYLGYYGVVVILRVIILFINVFLSLMLSLRVEVFSIKVFIYLFIIIFGILRIRTRLNYKLISFDKIKNFKEIWVVDYYRLDKFMFWNINEIFNYMRRISVYKLTLLINWWVVRVYIFFIYNESFKSVALKKLRFIYIFYGV